MPAKRAARKAERVHALRLPDQRRNPPEIRAVFARCMEKIGFVPNVLRSYTLRPRKFELFRRYNNELMLGESGPVCAGAGDDRGRRLLREPLPLLPGGARRAGPPALGRSGPGRSARRQLPGGAALPPPARDAGLHLEA